MECYCGSKKEFSECCGVFLSQKELPSTPLQLMRSRYSAYVSANAEYILNTTTKQNRFEHEIELIDEFCKSVTWLGLDIVYAKDNIVEFKAYYKDADGIKMQHERSTFVLEEGIWLYDSGVFLNSKIQRNDPCPCGSGKKYKKCCYLSSF
jgi:SEC-C motif-containing protein